MRNSLERTKIILVEPLGPVNLGSVARLCANFGISELRLVAPRCNPQDPEAIRMSVKGKKILEMAKQYPSLLEAVADCNRVVATCGRIDHGDIPLHSVEETIQWFVEPSNHHESAFVFGREDRGLTNEELLLAQKVITIQTTSTYPSLNLSHAVAIVLHEVNRLDQNQLHSHNQSHYVQTAASPKQLNDCLEDAEALLLEVGFLLEHTSSARMAKIKTLLQRAEIRPEEVSLIRGILRQVKWAINQ